MLGKTRPLTSKLVMVIKDLLRLLLLWGLSMALVNGARQGKLQFYTLSFFIAFTIFAAYHLGRGKK
jgi:hypothetical protein